jgi:hypothetical protein
MCYYSLIALIARRQEAEYLRDCLVVLFPLSLFDSELLRFSERLVICILTSHVFWKQKHSSLGVCGISMPGNI